MSWKHCHLQCRDSLTSPLRWQPHANKAERFDYVSKQFSSLSFKIPPVCLVPEQCLNMMPHQVMEFLKKMAGTEYVSFSNATWVQWHVKHNLTVLCHMKCHFEYQLCSCSFQSEKETGDRNYAIGYYLKEKKVIFFFCLISITLKACWVMKLSEIFNILTDLNSCSVFLTMQTWWQPLTSISR